MGSETQKLYAIPDESDGVRFETDGWTVEREALYDEVSNAIDPMSLYEMCSEIELKQGVTIGNAEHRDGWSVTIDDYFAKHCGWDDE